MCQSFIAHCRVKQLPRQSLVGPPHGALKQKIQPVDYYCAGYHKVKKGKSAQIDFGIGLRLSNRIQVSPVGMSMMVAHPAIKRLYANLLYQTSATVNRVAQDTAESRGLRCIIQLLGQFPDSMSFLSIRTQHRIALRLHRE